MVLVIMGLIFIWRIFKLKTMKNLFILLILVFLFSSCNNIPKNKFWWEAGISSPKYYLIGGAKVDLEYAGYGTLANIDNGWGDNYGAIGSIEKYKDLPRSAHIEYCSAVDNLIYEGTVALPYDKILTLFKKYCPNKEDDKAELVVGMAPGGWIRVWFETSIGYVNDGTGKNIQIEIAKAQLKGKQDLTLNPEFINKTQPYWDKYKTYWKHFGIPLEVWAENEKKYDIYFNFDKSNMKFIVNNAFYSSLDGTVYFGITNDEKSKKVKLPADLVLAWSSKNDTISYDTHVLMPKNFINLVKSKKTSNIELVLEIEQNGQFGILYLKTNNMQEKILRFKNSKRIKQGLGESNICSNVEYFKP